MLKKSLAVTGAVAGTLAFGGSVANADTVADDGTQTTTQLSTQPTDNGTVTLQPSTGSNSDTTTSGSGSSSSSTGTDTSTTDDGTTVTTPSGVDDDPTTVVIPDNGNSSSSSDKTDKDSSSISSDTTDEDSTSTSSDTTNNDDSSSTDKDSNSSSALPSDNDTKLPDKGVAPAPVPLTPSTPDVNVQGQLNQVTPVPVQTPTQGQSVAPVVPQEVASVPSVARSVQHYNETLSKNDNDGTKAPVVEAKKAVDEAVKKALPKTGVQVSQSSVGILSLLLGGLAMAGLYGVRKLRLK